jgi:hypothetical protein
MSTKITFRISDEQLTKINAKLQAQGHPTDITNTEKMLLVIDGFLNTSETLPSKGSEPTPTGQESQGSHLDSPARASGQLAGSEPVPLGSNSSSKQTASASTSMSLNSGRNAGKNISTISIQQQQRLEFERQRAEIRLKLEKDVQVVKEQVRRYRNTESLKRGSVEWETGGADHGRPDFTEYERYN